jgi:hypothetical protein
MIATVDAPDILHFWLEIGVIQKLKRITGIADLTS